MFFGVFVILNLLSVFRHPKKVLGKEHFADKMFVTLGNDFTECKIVLLAKNASSIVTTIVHDRMKSWRTEAESGNQKS
jgi:hypothetical protein